MLHLEVLQPNGRSHVAVDCGPYTIGRSSDNRLQLADGQVSRIHAELREEADGWHVRDCGSRFGTFLNDRKIVDEAALRPGDRLLLGKTEIRIVDEPIVAGGSASIDFQQMNALLTSLSALGSSRVLDEVLAIVLDSALEVTGAERGFILLADAAGQLALMLARARGRVTLPSAQTSQRIPEQVFSTGQDQIVMDLQEEEHAAMHIGTVALGIRHVLCTPLNVSNYGDGSVRRLGVLYLDSRERGYLQQVGALRALAAQAAVVVENARLYREVVERERTAQELRIAAHIQQALLPPPLHKGASASLAAKTTPCQDVGGDFFDYTERPDGGLAFVVGDVAGKGTSAALLTAVIQGLFAAEAETEDGPASVVARVNRALCRRAIEARFVTAFYAQLDAAGTLKYCNAGHNAPFLLTPGAVRRLDTGGTVLGLFAKATFETGTVPVASGDIVVVFSDGVTEAVNPAGEELGDEGLAACLRSVSLDEPAVVLDAIERQVRVFCGATAARDDINVMVVRVH
jgi:serine phosphatase RsbU (regulator of sigma subunit)